MFCRQPAGFASDPATVYEALCDGRAVDGLVPLPMDRIMDEVVAQFPGMERDEPYYAVWVRPHTPNNDLFEIEVSPTHVRIDLRPLMEDVANTLIDIMNDYGCALYDAQKGERFRQPEPRR